MAPVTEFFLGVAEMPTFNFLTCKSILHLSEHHKFEYFSQPWWDIQACEKINLWKDESVMVRNMFRNDMKFRSG